MPEDPWSSGLWPLMEEEILMIDRGTTLIFNFPLPFFSEHLKPVLEKGLLRPVRVARVKDSEGSERVVVEVDRESGVELKAWILLKISERADYFLTEVDSLYRG